MKRIFAFIAALFLFQTCVFAHSDIKTFEYYQDKLKEANKPYSVTGMVRAIAKGDAETVKLYLDAGMSPNDTYFSFPLTYFAVFKKNNDVLKLLLKYGANKEAAAKGTTLLIWSISRKNIDAVQILVDNGVNVNNAYNGYVPLNYAVKTVQPEIAEILVNAGAAINDSVIKDAERSKDEKIMDLVLR